MKFEDQELLLDDVHEILGELEYVLMNLEDIDLQELLEKMNELKKVSKLAKTDLIPEIKDIERLEEDKDDEGNTGIITEERIAENN